MKPPALALALCIITQVHLALCGLIWRRAVHRDTSLPSVLKGGQWAGWLLTSRLGSLVPWADHWSCVILVLENYAPHIQARLLYLQLMSVTDKMKPTRTNT